MAIQITNYQCPNCTGPLGYAGDSGKLECEHCGTSFDVSVIEQLYADKEEAAASAGTEPQWDMSHAGGEWSEDEAAHIVKVCVLSPALMRSGEYPQKKS